MKRIFAAAATAALLSAGAAHADHHGGKDKSASMEEKQNIVDTAAATGQFETLLAAAQAAGLAETLATGGPFTVFAPTDEAFAALPDGTVEELLMPENRDQLRSILLLHVVDGKTWSKDLDGQELTVTAKNGGDLMIDGTDGVTVNGIDVVKADVKASNGLIHVIDEVILP